jgi:hypothetical protein
MCKRNGEKRYMVDPKYVDSEFTKHLEFCFEDQRDEKAQSKEKRFAGKDEGCFIILEERSFGDFSNSVYLSSSKKIK